MLARHLEKQSKVSLFICVLLKLLNMWDHCPEPGLLEDSTNSGSSFGSNRQHVFNVVTLKISTFMS